jgi:tetratricopeptide (TPR) repeat protein
MFEEEKKGREAAEWMEGYLKEHPLKDTRIYFSLGSLYDDLKDWQRGLEYMQKVLEIDPQHPQALNYVGYTWAEHDMRLDEAEKYVKKAVELMPGNGYIIDSLGWVYYKQGRFDDAVAALTQATVASAADATIWEHLGDALTKAGKAEEATKAYEKSKALKESKSAPPSEKPREAP